MSIVMGWDGVPALHRHPAPDLAGASMATLLARLGELPWYDAGGRFDRAADELRQAIKWECAVRFGADRGWRLSDSWFPLSRLRPALPRRPAYPDRMIVDARQFLDHAYRYRIGRRAAAIVSHPYSWTDARTAAAKQHAAMLGIAVDVPGDPSWWLPPRTTLVVWTRIAPPTDGSDGPISAPAEDTSAKSQAMERHR